MVSKIESGNSNDKIDLKQIDNLFDEKGLLNDSFKSLNDNQKNALISNDAFSDKVKRNELNLPIIFDSLASSGLKFDEKRSFFDIRDSSFRRKFIKDKISQVRGKSDLEKEFMKNQLSNVFNVATLFSAFGPNYSRNAIDNKKQFFLNRALSSKGESPQKYDKKTGTHNIKIKDRFLDTMFDLANTKSEIKKGNLSDEHSGYLEKFLLYNKLSPTQKLAIIQGINSLGEDNKTKINKLTEVKFNQYLSLVYQKGIEKSKGLKDVNVSDRGADSIGTAEVIVEILSKLDSLLEKNNISTEVSESEIIDNRRNSILETNPEYVGLKEKTRIGEDGSKEVYLEKDLEEIIIYSSTDTYQNTATEFGIKKAKLRKLNNPDLNTELDQIESDFYNAYVAAGKVEILEKSRGKEYIAEVKNRAIVLQEKTIESHSSYSSSKAIESNLKQNLENITELNTVVNDKKLQGNLSDEKFEEILNGDSPEKDPSKINHKKLELITGANETIKNGFVDRLNYFFTNILDVQIGKDGQENILKNIEIAQKSDKKTESAYKISIDGKFNGTDLNFIYDINTGELETNQLLSNDKYTENIDFNNKMKVFQNLNGPKLGDYKTVSENIDYGDVLVKSKGNNESSSKEINDELLDKYPRVDQSNVFKLEMKKQVLTNIATKEILDMVGISGKSFLDRPIDGGDQRYSLLPLLARSFNDYDIDELNKFRETTKYMSDFYQEIDQFENTENNVLENNNLNIQSKLEALNTKVSPRYAKTKEYVQRIFVDKEKNESKTNYTGQQFYSFFSSFLTGGERLSKDGKKIIDPTKLKMFQDDLQQEYKQENSRTGDYLANLDENMEKEYANKDLETNLKKMNSNTSPEYFA